MLCLISEQKGAWLPFFVIVAFAALFPMTASAQAAPAPAEPTPDAREVCLRNHEQSQVLRIDRKLRAARDAAQACAVTACPAAVRSDCSEWIAELSKLIPRVILVAESGSTEVENVRVTIDGNLLTEKLDGSALEVEPGPHLLRFEYGTEPAVERQVNVPEGEKSFQVRVRFEDKTLPPPVAPVAPPPEEPGPREPGERPVPVLTYVLGGVAVAAAVTSAVLAAGAFSDRDDAVTECAPNCDPARVDSIHNQFIAADVAGGVAIVSAGFAVFSFLTRPEVPKERAHLGAPRFGFAVGPSRLEVTAGGRF